MSKKIKRIIVGIVTLALVLPVLTAYATSMSEDVGSELITSSGNGSIIIGSVTESEDELPDITSMTATPEFLTWKGGVSTITLTGDNIADGTVVTAFLDNVKTGITGTIEKGEAKLTFPESDYNVGQTRYEIRYSLDGGENYSYDHTAWVYVEEKTMYINIQGADPYVLEHTGGKVAMEYGGTGFYPDLRVAVFKDDKDTGIYADIKSQKSKDADCGEEFKQFEDYAKAILSLPANLSETEDETYDFKLSVDGGATYRDYSISVTVKAINHYRVLEKPDTITKMGMTANWKTTGIIYSIMGFTFGEDELIIGYDNDTPGRFIIYLEDETEVGSILAGSLIIELNSDYIDTFSDGTYPLKIEFEDGEINSELEIARDKNEDPKEETKDDKKDTTSSSSSSDSKAKAAATSDSNSVMLLMIFMAASLIVIMKRRKTHH